MAQTIAGKVIIITGASSGIGRATTLALGSERANLVLVARRERLLAELEDAVCERGAAALSLALDLRSRQAVERMVQAARERFGRIDILINNAGFGFYGSVENTPESVVREIFALNFDAPLYATQLVIPLMRAQGRGHIINVSSLAGKRGMPLGGIYSASKFALQGISEALRVELDGSGIDISIINPGPTETEFGSNVRLGDVKHRFRAVGRIQSAEAVAASIIGCIKHPKAEVYPYRGGKLLAWINAVAPSFIDKMMRRIMRERLAARAPVHP